MGLFCGWAVVAGDWRGTLSCRMGVACERRERVFTGTHVFLESMDFCRCGGTLDCV